MSTIIVETAGRETMDRAARLLSGIKGGTEKAVKRAMARSVAHLRTESAREIRKQYAISTANIRANETVHVRYTYQNGVQAYVTFSGHKIPLHRYDGVTPAVPTQDTGRWVRAKIDGKWFTFHPSVQVRARKLKDKAPKPFVNAFVAQMKSGHIGIFERTGGVTGTDRDKIEEKMGDAVPQMLGSKAVEERLAKGAMEKFEQRLDHEIQVILNGWGE